MIQWKHTIKVMILSYVIAILHYMLFDLDVCVYVRVLIIKYNSTAWRWPLGFVLVCGFFGVWLLPPQLQADSVYAYIYILGRFDGLMLWVFPLILNRIAFIFGFCFVLLLARSMDLFLMFHEEWVSISRSSLIWSKTKSKQKIPQWF